MGTGTLIPLIWERLPEVFPGELEAYLAHPEDLPFAPESIAAAAERVVDLVHDLATSHPGTTVVLVSHQDPIQATRLALTGRRLGDLPSDKPGHGTVITLTPGNPWTEVSRWDPNAAGAGPFPPST